MTELKGTPIETPEQEEAFVPSEEWYYIPLCKNGMGQNWEVIPCYTADLRIKQQVVDLVRGYKDWETKIIKIKLPISEE